MKAEDVRKALTAAYQTRESAVIFEVPDGVSGNANRYCDAMVAQMWNSRGLELEGFEIKVSRSDWTRELQMPSKAESHFGYCDRWWLITPHTGTPIARPDEIPGPWGWMLVTDKGELKIAKKAPKLVPTKAFDRAFGYALLRAACRRDEKEIAAAVAKAVENERANITERVNAQAALLAGTSKERDAIELYRKLQIVFGRNFHWMNHDDVIAAIAAVHKAKTAGRGYALDGVADMLRQASDAVKAAQDAMAAIDEFGKDGIVPSAQRMGDIDGKTEAAGDAKSGKRIRS